MKSTKYSNFCLSLFDKFFLRYNKKPMEQKNLIFVKANIQMSYEEYYSTALLNIILGLLISLFFSIFFYFLFSLSLTIFIIPLLVTFAMIVFYYYYPYYNYDPYYSNPYYRSHSQDKD